MLNIYRNVHVAFEILLTVFFKCLTRERGSVKFNCQSWRDVKWSTNSGMADESVKSQDATCL